MIPRVKICCISSIEEANLAISLGASALGLVGNMPSGPGIISDSQIAAIAASVPPPIATFLLTSETTVAGIVSHHQKVNTTTIQLVDTLSEGTYSDIKKQLPSIKIVQVVHVVNEQSIDEALGLGENVDAILLDSGNPNLQIKELGGTGRVHNWTISRRIVEQSKIPVFLAGGLTPENIQQAIDTVQPFGLDLCSGVRSKGKLNPKKLERFMNIVLR
jgi:phosphoribosylanthranilate isomerase